MLTGIVVTALCLAATAPLNTALVAREFSASAFGRAVTAAAKVSKGRPLVAVVGSSATESGVEAKLIEAALAGDGAPVVSDIATGGLHASVAPCLVRRLADETKLDLLVLELGHIAHDQYGGAWIVRNFVTDESVLAGFETTPRGRRLLGQIEDERRFPWLATPRLLRVVLDSSTRESFEKIDRIQEESRGFVPYTTRKDFDQVVAKLRSDPAFADPDLEDACPQHVFTAAAKVCDGIVRSKGARMVVYVHPVNRAVASRVNVIRHFEATARAETIPALQAAGIEVLVPPERFFDSSMYADHAHFHREGAAEFSQWLAGELKRVRAEIAAGHSR